MKNTYLILVVLVLSACGRKSGPERANFLQHAESSSYTQYLAGDPAFQLSTMEKFIGELESSDRDAWKYIDREKTYACAYGRASIAAGRLAKTELAEKYRKQAVVAYQRRREWNAAYQESFPITPSPHFKVAELELFQMLKKMDDAMRP